MFEIKIENLQTGGVNALSPPLGTDTTFLIELIPPVGAVLFIERTTPVSLEIINNLN